jgi:hypothetical protein
VTSPKKRRGGGGESDPEIRIAIGTKAPFQSRMGVAEIGDVDWSRRSVIFRSFQCFPVILGGFPGGLLQFTAAGQLLERISPRRLNWRPG